MGILATAGCSKDSDEPTTNSNTPDNSQSFEISGSVSKGSFVAGSSLTFFELDDELKQTGRSFTSNIEDDLGNYELSATGVSQPYTRVTGEGFYWNEVSNENTQNRISLVALSKFNSSINVNILTHLEADRVRYLYTEEGLTFDQAKEQALNEILAAFDITPSIRLKNAEEFSFSKGDETSKILLVLSAVIQGNRTVSEVSVLLSELSLEFKNNGNIEDVDLIAELASDLQILDMDILIRNVLNKYSQAYPELTEESFRSNYLDSIRKPNGKFLVDLDFDGVTDDIDQCLDTEEGTEVNSLGCADSQLDTDNDGVADDLDLCPNTSEGDPVNADGCATNQLDTDGDGVVDSLDQCPETTEGLEVNELGCAANERDTDNDGVADDLDLCPNTSEGDPVNADGCATNQLDTDGDGVVDSLDQCPETTEGLEVNELGCAANERDTDNDGVLDSNDQCPNTDPGKEVNLEGCALNQLDSDQDGVNNEVDVCPNTPQGETVGALGCKDFIFIDANGITVKASQNAVVGDRKVLNGKEYIVVDRPMLVAMINSGEDVSVAVTTLINNMGELFADNSNFNQDISSWDVSNVTDMHLMFYRASSFNQPIGIWDTSNVTSLWAIFASASSFNQPVNNWDTSKARSMEAIFGQATSFNQPLDNWDLSSAVDMIAMFSGASSFNQDISSWDVSNITDMQQMFIGATAFNQDLSSWNVTNVTTCNTFSDNTPNWILPKPNFINCNPN
ncbi:BspA family leucine-rich repeat surface protein [Robiginitalea sp. SC105]|uniref:BspA family leucine-rich repeat surface protein n=1 Tax=Robiginitalea sp. SC105 TaxID=2762332 RepID=UPI001C8EDE73|nr:BspA family leucine-rich repeat surface protein [Robiginitalea sp. SC105]